MENENTNNQSNNQDSSTSSSSSQNIPVNSSHLTITNRPLTIYRKYKNDIIGALYGFILVMLAFLLVQLNLILLDNRTNINKTIANINNLTTVSNEKVEQILTKIDSTMTSVDSAAKEVENVSKAQAKIYTDPDTIKGINVFLRSADDFARIVDNLLDSSRTIKRDLLPNTNQILITANGTLGETTKTIRVAGETIASLGTDGKLVLNESASSIKQIRTLLEDPNIKEAIAKAVEIENQSIMLIANANSIVKDIDDDALPALIANLKAVGNNTEKSSDEVLTFLKGLNKPQTKKQRLLKFLLEAIIKSSPVLLGK